MKTTHIKRSIAVLDAAGFAAAIPALADILLDCVQGGASVSFMASLTRERAEAFWRAQREEVTAGERLVIVASLDGTAVGTVSLVLKQPDNQPHRADLAKMLVHRSGRRQGIGQALLRAAEQQAVRHRKTLLVLDTVAGDAGERLYQANFWQRAGTIPNYALMPDGTFCDTVYYYRALDSAPVTPTPVMPANIEPS